MQAVHKANVEKETPWMTTYHGTFDFQSPEQIDMRDIVRGLSHQSRYHGQTTEIYTIAQHSAACHELAIARDLPPAGRRAALLHDAAEAYVGDLSRPLRRKLSGSYEEIESRVLRMIAGKYDFPFPIPDVVREIDNDVYHLERRGISKHQAIDVDLSWEVPDKAAQCLSRYWTPQEARIRFAHRTDNLVDGAHHD